MNLLDKSLRLALLAGATLLIACPPGGKEETGEADADTDTDTDADADTDADTDVDTGLAQLYYVANFATAAGEFTSASFGFGYYGLAAEDWVCVATGNLPYEGEAPAGCPDCEWAFDLGGIEGSTGVGDYCDQFGGAADGALDTYFDHSWGYTPVYYYDYAGTPLALEQTITIYSDGYGWGFFAYNYNGSAAVVGDSESLSAARPWYSKGEFYYYPYYP